MSAEFLKSLQEYVQLVWERPAGSVGIDVGQVGVVRRNREDLHDSADAVVFQRVRELAVSGLPHDVVYNVLKLCGVVLGVCASHLIVVLPRVV